MLQQHLEIYVLKLLKINRALIARFMILSHVYEIWARSGVKG